MTAYGIVRVALCMFLCAIGSGCEKVDAVQYWEGRGCVMFRESRELACSDLNITSNDVEMIAQSKAIAKLSFRNCRAEPDIEFGTSTPALTELVIIDCQMPDALYRWFGQEQRLNKVEVVGKGNMSPLLDELLRGQPLAALRLSGVDVDHTVIEALTTETMVSLELEHTEISAATLNCIAKLQGLTVLSFAESDVSSCSLDVLKHLKNLAVLDLADATVNDDHLDVLAWLPALRTVHLDGTGVGHRGFHALRRSSIRTVTLDRCVLTATAGQALSAIETLKRIRARKASLDNFLPSLLKMSSLLGLDLGGSNLDDTMIEEMVDIYGPVILDIRDTSLSDSGARRLATWKRLRAVIGAGTSIAREGTTSMVDSGICYVDGPGVDDSLLMLGIFAPLSATTELGPSRPDVNERFPADVTPAE